jgi:hypothetical protein
MVSPRMRAQRTFELLFAGVPAADRPKMQIDERVREWTYGDYEGPFSLPSYPRHSKPVHREAQGGSERAARRALGHLDARLLGRRECRADVRARGRCRACDPGRAPHERQGRPPRQPRALLARVPRALARAPAPGWAEVRARPRRRASFIFRVGREMLTRLQVCVCQYYHDLDHPAVGAINLGVL